MYDPYQIVWAKLDWKNCPDERPWLLIDIRCGGERYGAFPISSKDYRSGGHRILLPENHKDFSETGLKEKSYIYDENIFDIGDDEIRRPCGLLVGDLLAEFKLEAGL